MLFAWRRATLERSDYYTVRARLVGGDETDPGPIGRKPHPRQREIAMFKIVRLLARRGIEQADSGRSDAAGP